MGKFFKDKKNKINLSNEYYQTLCKALESTTSVCIASTSALVVNSLTAKIHPDRMAQYKENSLIAVNGIGKLRIFLMKISKHLEEKKIDFLDARMPIKCIILECGAANCEHQSFYLAALLRQHDIPANIYDIEDIKHTVVVTKDFLIDPWIGRIFPLTGIDLGEFYGSSLNMKASWLNQLLSNKEFTFHERLSKRTLGYYFAPQEKDKAIDVGCCIIF